MGPLDLRAVLEGEVGWRDRWVPDAGGLTVGAVGEQGWNVLAGDVLFPVMVLKERALAHNARLMARWCADRGVSLAPHGKTSMAPQLMELQLDEGAWALTAATAAQARAYRAFGADRILLANELVDPAGLAWVAAELDAHPAFRLWCLADDERAVALMDGRLSEAGAARPLEVLVELGAPGGRAGCRSDETATSVAGAVARSPRLRLAGVEAYEGVLSLDGRGGSAAAVDELLARLVGVTVALDRLGAFADVDEVLVSAGGSVRFDRVVAATAGMPALSRPHRVVLRSGCYLTHDDDDYARTSPLRGRDNQPGLQPALELWSQILSVPEPGLAIAGFGKRDAPYDVALPLPRLLVRAGEASPRLLAGGLTVTALNDQHAYLRVDGVELAPGDLLGCGISHPCTAFDKWRLLAMVDDDYQVTGAVRTFF